MPLEDLYQLIGTLRERIQQHSVALRQSEMLTRYVLIDPLLRELGWDTEDPEQVQPEYRSGQGFADYALLSGGKVVVMVEAKKLDNALQEGLMQSINYCLMDGTPYFAVTDGRKWEVYETHRPAPINEKRVVEFDVAGPTPSEVVLKAIALWRPNVETGQPTQPQPPIVTPKPPSPSVGPTPQFDGNVGLPTIGQRQLAAMPDGELVLCPSKPSGIEFLKTFNAWGFIRLNRTPKYLALYVGRPVSAIQFLGEVEKVVAAESSDCPISPDHPYYEARKKLVMLRKDRLWELANPIPLGAPKPGKAPQGLRFLPLSKLSKARTLDDLKA